MAPFRFILAATDFSPEGNNAVYRAAAMARQSGARRGIVHVVDPAGYQPLRDWRMPSYQLDVKGARALAQLRQLAIDVAHGQGLTPSVQVQEGDVSQEVARVAATADLLVLELAPELTLRLFHALDPVGETIMREAEVPASVVREVRARENAGALARMRCHVTRLGLDHRTMQFPLAAGGPRMRRLNTRGSRMPN